MKALLIWKDCDRFKVRQDGYWIECPANEIEKLIKPLSNHDKHWIDRKDDYLSSKFASANPELGLQTDCYYFLVSKDGNEIMPTEPYYPYSGQWNAYCPFETIEPRNFTDLEELKELE